MEEQLIILSERDGDDAGHGRGVEAGAELGAEDPGVGGGEAGKCERRFEVEDLVGLYGSGVLDER